MQEQNNIITDKIPKDFDQRQSKRLNICLSVIKKARTQRRTKALSCYYLLKSTYHNSCIFNYKQHMGSLASSLGICEKTLYNYLHHLKRLELVSDHSGNLILNSTKKLKDEARERKKYYITIADKEDIETIESRLFAKIIETHCKKIAFHRAIKKFENKGFNSHEPHKIGELENDIKTSLSARNLQKLFNLSQLKTKKIVDKLNTLGVIKTTRGNRKLLAYGAAPLKYSTEFPGYHFLKDGFLFVLFGDRHEMIEHPVTIKKLTYRQYLTINKRMTCKNQYNIKIV